jgi:hypothetical protein
VSGSSLEWKIRTVSVIDKELLFGKGNWGR